MKHLVKKHLYTGVACSLCILIGAGVTLSSYAAGQKVSNTFETTTCTNQVLSSSTDTSISSNVKKRLIDIGVSFSQRIQVNANSQDNGASEYAQYVNLGASRLNEIERRIQLSQVQVSMINIVSNFLTCQGQIAQGDDFNFIQVILNNIGISNNSISTSTSSSSGGSTNSSSSSGGSEIRKVCALEDKNIGGGNSSYGLRTESECNQICYDGIVPSEEGYTCKFGGEILREFTPSEGRHVCRLTEDVPRVSFLFNVRNINSESECLEKCDSNSSIKKDSCIFSGRLIRDYGRENGSSSGSINSSSTSSSSTSTSSGSSGGTSDSNILSSRIPNDTTRCRVEIKHSVPSYLSKNGRNGNPVTMNNSLCIELCDNFRAIEIMPKLSCHLGGTNIKTYRIDNSPNQSFGPCKYINSSGNKIDFGEKLFKACLSTCDTENQKNNSSGKCEHRNIITKTYAASNAGSSGSSSPSGSTPTGPETVPTKVTMNCGIARDAVSNWYYTKGRCPAQAGYDNWMGQVSQRMKNGMKGVDAVNEVFPLFASAYNQSCSAYGNLSACHDAQLCPAGYTYVRNSTNCNKK